MSTIAQTRATKNYMFPNLEMLLLKEEVMDKDRVAGSAKDIKGSIKQAVGKAVGDAKLEAEGKADKIEGKVQNAIGSIKDTVKDALKGN